LIGIAFGKVLHVCKAQIMVVSVGFGVAHSVRKMVDMLRDVSTLITWHIRERRR
jgi:hypothetical protein